MSGHSKWSQIKHKKGITDAKKGRLFSKIVREILVAARVGGAQMQANPRLRSAIERGHAIGLPKENIERAIAKASGSTEGAELQEFLYEATVPGGVSILIEGITDNKNRSFSEIRHLLAERGAKMADPGSVLWNFDKVGTIEIAEEDNHTKTKDEIELIIIESGASDFTSVDRMWIAETSFTEAEKVRRALEANGIMIKEIGHDYKPKNALILSPEKKDSLESFLDALTDHEDVQEVYTNLSS